MTRIRSKFVRTACLRRCSADESSSILNPAYDKATSVSSTEPTDRPWVAENIWLNLIPGSDVRMICTFIYRQIRKLRLLVFLFDSILVRIIIHSCWFHSWYYHDSYGNYNIFSSTYLSKIFHSKIRHLWPPSPWYALSYFVLTTFEGLPPTCHRQNA